ncbi:MAG TPA: hypothetical protein VMR70_03775 [Flavisolibacter sp.]|nr:hypothetical protein [Flavisolibacter sp.]
MKKMKRLFVLLFLPLFTYSQTIHYKKDEILYKGDVNMVGFSAAEMTARLQHALQVAVEESKATMEVPTSGNSLVSSGEMKLTSPYHIKMSLLFNLQLTPTANGYKYQIDSVKVQEAKRYSKTTVIPSKELLEGIEETGLAAIETEHLLNEIDLRLQKLLTILEREARIGKPEEK